MKIEDDGMCCPDKPEKRCICREEFGYKVCGDMPVARLHPGAIRRLSAYVKNDRNGYPYVYAFASKTAPNSQEQPVYLRPAVVPKPNGAERIAAERARQMESGRMTSHDVRAYGANYTSDLALAALAYLAYAAARPGLRECARIDGAPDPWPWDNTCWRPGPDDSKASRIRELEKAGALIAAEIDRLLACD